jgi:hypothetical protein
MYSLLKKVHMYLIIVNFKDRYSSIGRKSLRFSSAIYSKFYFDILNFFDSLLKYLCKFCSHKISHV